MLCHRLAIQEKPFAAPLRLIAAGLNLHSVPLAPPPYKHEGPDCIPITLGEDTHGTAAAQGTYITSLLTHFYHLHFPPISPRTFCHFAAACLLNVG